MIPPYGGKLVNLLVKGEERSELIRYAHALPPIQLSARSVCDIELLAVGAFSALDRFMDKADYACVLEEKRLSNGILFPIPITLPIADTQHILLGKSVALRSSRSDLFAVMTVEEVFEWDLSKEAICVYGTTDTRHPLVAEMASWGRAYISGTLKVGNLPKHYDFVELRKTPAEVQGSLQSMGCARVIAFQTRNPIHRAHEELTKRAAHRICGALLIHPVVGLTKLLRNLLLPRQSSNARTEENLCSTAL